MISQKNVMYQLAYTAECLRDGLVAAPQEDPRHKLCGWMPHWCVSAEPPGVPTDIVCLRVNNSLVGCFLWSLHEGIECYMMSP